MLDRVFDLYDELERQKIMLSFKGDLSSELVTALLDVVERKMDVIEPESKMRKRVFNVVMECLQNLYHHNAKVAPSGNGTGQGAEPQGVVMIAHNEMGYSVLTGNFMAGEEVGALKAHLERINAMDQDELRDFYKEVLNNGRFSDAGGGGLGMIDIARKSRHKLEFGFVPFDKDNAFFSLNVNVTN